MFIVFTTAARREDADGLARFAVEHRLAVCAQVEGPIQSHYWWRGEIEQSEEWRVVLKCLEGQLQSLEERLLPRHPYSTPEWIVVRADHVGEKYLNWGIQNSSPLPFSPG
jgi:periplasmic divalent cation tolerance protein